MKFVPFTQLAFLVICERVLVKLFSSFLVLKLIVRVTSASVVDVLRKKASNLLMATLAAGEVSQLHHMTSEFYLNPYYPQS